MLKFTSPRDRSKTIIAIIGAIVVISECMTNHSGMNTEDLFLTTVGSLTIYALLVWFISSVKLRNNKPH